MLRAGDTAGFTTKIQSGWSTIVHIKKIYLIPKDPAILQLKVKIMLRCDQIYNSDKSGLSKNKQREILLKS